MEFNGKEMENVSYQNVIKELKDNCLVIISYHDPIGMVELVNGKINIEFVFNDKLYDFNQLEEKFASWIISSAYQCNSFFYYKYKAEEKPPEPVRRTIEQRLVYPVETQVSDDVEMRFRPFSAFDESYYDMENFIITMNRIIDSDMWSNIKSINEGDE